jgi:thiamine-phosphate pyrophosphorylase
MFPAESRLYLCTDARGDLTELERFLDIVLAAGVGIVQLRDKRLEAKDELECLAVMSKAAARHDCLVAVNDRADIALAANSSILHLGQQDLPVSVAREILGDRVLLGRSTHSEAEIEAAATDPLIDYFCVGPVWSTPTKPGRPAVGLPLVEYASARANRLPDRRPWFAIGGIDLDNLDQVLAAEARRVVVVRAITEASDPGAATAELVSRLNGATR